MRHVHLHLKTSIACMFPGHVQTFFCQVQLAIVSLATCERIPLLYLYCGGFQRLRLPSVSEHCLEMLALKELVDS